jgi:anti-sigma regulatory factor (Ser/Thr protein kinase)
MRARISFEADLRAPYRARKWLEGLQVPLTGDRADRLEWLVAELVTASVKHAIRSGERELELEFAAVDGIVRVEVSDPGRTGAPRVPDQPDDATGFGYYLLHKLGDRWGATDGAVPGLWVEMDVYSLDRQESAAG